MLKNLVSITCFLLFFFINLANLSAYSTYIDEEKLGKQVFSLVLKHIEFVEDPELTTYISEIGYFLIKKGTYSIPSNFKFFLVKSPQFNAFNLPGNYILVNTGVFKDIESEDELAGIIAHEIAHALKHHVIKQLKVAERLSLTTIALTLASLLLGGPEVGIATHYTTSAVMQTKFLAYSRKDEREADIVGMEILRKAGYSPLGMVKIMQKLSLKGDFETQLSYQYLLTHPLTTERLTYLSFLAKKYKGGKEYIISPNSTYFKRLKTKAFVYSSSAEDLISTYKEICKRNPDFWNRYILALSFLEAGYFKEAENLLINIVKETPVEHYFWIDLAELYLKWGKYKKVLSVIENYDKKRKKLMQQNDFCAPWEVKIKYLLGTALLGEKRYKKAWQVLKDLENVSALQCHPIFFFTLGKICHTLNKQGLSHFYFGKYYEIKGEYSLAFYHYSKALYFLDKTDKIYTKALAKVKELKEYEKGIK